MISPAFVSTAARPAVQTVAPVGSTVTAPRPVAKQWSGADASLMAAATAGAVGCVARGAGSRRRMNKRSNRVQVAAVNSSEEFSLMEPPPEMILEEDDPTAYTIGILGDLHLDPRDLEDSMTGREHMIKALGDRRNPTPNKFICSLGDLGESKDCLGTGELFSGTTPCFELANEFLTGFGVPFDVCGGNHDLEGIDEFNTDGENLKHYMRHLGKETPQFAHEVAEKVVVMGLGSTAFRTATYTSHEVAIDPDQLHWFETTIKNYPASEGWTVFLFSHAPIIGSALRVLQTNHVVNGCCWLNHTDPIASKKFIQVCRENSCIKAWFSGHFHLSHDYEDSITFPGGNNRGSCVFAQTGVMTARSTRDGRKHSRFLRGNSEGFEICTLDHSKGGIVRLDATIKFADFCEVPEGADMDMMEEGARCETIVFAHKHADYDHDQWFQAYVPQENDGNYVVNVDGTLNHMDSGVDYGVHEEVSWWHMKDPSTGKDGAVLGCHNGMIIEYDAQTLAPLGMVVSRDELLGRRVAVIDDEWGGSALVLYDDEHNDATVVQPNEDGSYWRKVVRNKMHRMREMRRVAAAKTWMSKLHNRPSDEVEVLSSYGPYTTTAGQVMGISTKAVCSTKLAKEADSVAGNPFKAKA